MPVLKHERLDSPSIDDTIWRYMNLSKFEDLVKRSQLYFCRLDKFENDPMEGIPPERNFAPDFSTTVHHLELNIVDITQDGRITMERNFQKKMVPLKEQHGKDYEKWVVENKRKNLLDRQTMFVNCWHKNAGENEAFWRMYYDPNEPTVAIKANVKKLKDAFKTQSWVYIADVQYYDENGSIPEGNGLYQVVYKRKQFEYEKEVRLIYWSGLTYNKLAPPMKDSRIDVDLNVLVSEIWLSPKASKNDFDKVQSLVSKAGLTADIKISTVLKKPNF